MTNEENNWAGVLILVLALLVLVPMLASRFRQEKKRKIETMQARSYATSVLRENKEVFEKLSEM